MSSSIRSTSRTLLAAATTLSLTLCESRLLNNEAGNYISVYDDTGVWSWAEALAHCELVYGSSLASIHSNTDEYLCGLSRYTHTEESWIGLTDQDAEGQWEWIDGTPYDYNITWYPGEPNDQNNEDCAQYLQSNETAARARANDIPCSFGYHQFICNAPAEMETVTEVREENDSGLIAGLIVVSVLLGLCCFGVLSSVAFYFFYNKKMESLAKDGKGAAMFQMLNPDNSEQTEDAAAAGDKSATSVVNVEPNDTEN